MSAGMTVLPVRSTRASWIYTSAAQSGSRTDRSPLRYAARVNGLHGIAMTKLDVLTGFETVKIAVGYRIDGKVLDEMPSDPELLERAEAVYEEVPGWSEKLEALRTWDDLPPRARAYVKRVEELVGVAVIGLSVGADRGETILLENPFRV